MTREPKASGRSGHQAVRIAGTPIQDALESLAAAQEGRRATPPHRPGASRHGIRYLGPAASLIALLVVPVLWIMPGAARAERQGCPPITYAFREPPPDHVVAELRLAIGEIHRRTGLSFEPGPQSSSALSVTWSARGVVDGPGALGGSERGARRILGYGASTWRRAGGGRELVAGVIQVDATTQWPLGLDRRDALAAVFVHELGHVIGLRHSPHPDSFMHELVSPMPPRWTAEDLDQLAQAGRQSGCRRPPSATPAADAGPQTRATGA